MSDDDDRGATGEAMVEAVQVLSEETRKRLARSYPLHSTADKASSRPECSGNCYSLTESGGPYIDPKCPKHGKWVAQRTDGTKS